MNEISRMHYEYSMIFILDLENTSLDIIYHQPSIPKTLNSCDYIFQSITKINYTPSVPKYKISADFLKSI